VAQAARDVDAGLVPTDHPPRMIEENVWRAVRHGLDGELIDLDSQKTYPAVEALPRLLEWTAPARSELGIEVMLPSLNGAQRQRRMSDAGGSLEEIYAATVAETRETYAGALEPSLSARAAGEVKHEH
jgi:carboxylate-amine ligase